ncbi:MAG TPA: phasin family protein [Burkholderiales bacterium]|nr:phasin family protein [Burkholderiales bacterium]
MFVVPEDVSAFHKGNLDALLKFTDTLAQASEQLFDLQVKSAKAGTAEAIKQLRALTGAKDVQEFVSLQTSFSQANAEKVFGFARAVYGWATETQAEISKLVDGQVSELNKSLATTIDKAAKAAPSGSEYAFAAVKQAMSSANQAYDAITKASKQVVEMTEATVASTANSIAPAAAKKKVA